MKKTIVIGIDGGCWEYIKPLLSNGKLPNLYQLIEKGIHGVLKSTMIPLSPIAWSSFITGKNPGKHGIFDWFVRDSEGNFKPVCGKDRKEPPFWRYLNKHGLKVGISNIPLTYPADNVEGFFISGFDSPEDSPLRTFPSSLSQLNGYGEYPLNPPHYRLLREVGSQKFADIYFRHIYHHTSLIIDLIEAYAIDVVIVNYMVVDQFNHYMKEYNFIEKGLIQIDRNIGRLMRKFSDSNFIIISDHGSCRTKKGFLIFPWLHHKGFLEINKEYFICSEVDAILKKSLNRKIWKKIIGAILRRSKILRESFSKVVLKDTHLMFKNRNIANWKDSPILFYSTAVDGFYLKDKTKTEELIKLLINLKDPETGKSLVKIVGRGRDIYGGNYAEQAPDVIMKFFPWIWVADNWYSTDQDNFIIKQEDLKYYGNHTVDGIYIFSGDCFRKGRFSELQIVDIPALILYLNGVPIPKDFDGMVEVSLFNPDFIKENSIKYQTDIFESHIELKDIFTSVDEENIKKNLEDLGYF